MKKPVVALFGSSSHIAKGLIYHFLHEGDVQLHLYTTSPERLNNFLSLLERNGVMSCAIHSNYDDLTKNLYDVIINCVGVGTLHKIGEDYSLYFTVGEKYDNLAIDYVRHQNPNSLYVSFSSGAVYGKEYREPVDNGSVNCIAVNHVDPQDYYAITRLYSEAKHRALMGLNIVDLRVFSYFSRFIDIEDGYFITEVLKCIRENRELVTSQENIVRDYVHPRDLFSAIRKSMDKSRINGAFDISSTLPVNKAEMLHYFSDAYGLRYRIDSSLNFPTATGSKLQYYSRSGLASGLDYTPCYSSLDTIKEESRYVLSNDHKRRDHCTRRDRSELFCSVDKLLRQ